MYLCLTDGRIYKTDDERKMNFEDADKFGIMVKNIYKERIYNS